MSLERQRNAIGRFVPIALEPRRCISHNNPDLATDLGSAYSINGKHNPCAYDISKLSLHRTRSCNLSAYSSVVSG